MRTLKPFDYFEPTTVKEAVKLLSTHGEKAQVLAGGIDLIPRMRKGAIKADYLINIQNIPELEYINNGGTKGLKFGAMARLHSLETSKEIQKNYPLLYEAIHQITSVQTKYMGTAVGNICVGTPASDVATVLLALDAELTIAGANSERTEPMPKFYADYLRTSLKRDEMVTGVSLPKPPIGMGTAFLNLVRTHADIAKVTVAVAIIIENDICKEARIAIGAAAPTVFRATKAETALKGQKVSSQAIAKAAETAAGETKPITDLRSTAEYRKEMARVLVTRALEKALERARA
jgi:CO/xanthine dehydrogenase FAD-binding subunit